MLSSQAQVLSTGDLTAGYRPAVAGFDELMTPSGAIKAQWLPFLEELAALDPATRSARMDNLNTRVRETGIAYDLFSDPASTVQPWRVDLVPLHLLARGVARAGARADPARPAVRGDAGRSLRVAAPAGDRRHSASAGVQRSGLPAAMPASQAGRRLHPVLRGRPGAWPRRALARDRHAHRDAGRHRLRARQPHGAHQRRRRPVRRLPRAEAGAVLPADADRARAARQSPRPDHRPADAGPAPQRLLQPCLSRPLPRPAAGGGRRPARGRRPRLAEDARRPDADRPDRALHCRRGRRSARARFVGLCRAGGTAAGRARAVRPGGQLAGLGAGREPRPRLLSAAAGQRTAARGPRHRRRAALVAGRAGGAAACAGQPRPHGHPPGAREHGPARARRARPRSGPHGADRAGGAAAGHRAEGRRCSSPRRRSASAPRRR